jgi:antitoxin ParD1/3/4
MKNTTISLGAHFDNYVTNQLAEGRYSDASEVIRAGLRLLENEDRKLLELRTQIQQGIDSGIAQDFDSELNLKRLKAARIITNFI